MLHARVQHAFLKVNRKLRGLVETDETYVGAITPWQGGRGTGKAPVAMAVEVRGEHAGRLAAEVLPDVSGEPVRGFVQENVQAGSSFAPGSIVKTDGWAGYQGLDECGYQHAPEVEGDPRRAMEILPLFHEAAGNLKRVLYGTHAGRVSRKHLPGYLAAFAFRYNHRGFLERPSTAPFAGLYAPRHYHTNCTSAESRGRVID